MEQPNNMMMPNGMGGGGVGGGMQRAQSGNFQQQIHGKIVQDLKSGMHKFAGGWQQSHPLNDRAARIMQLVSQLRLINTDVNVCLAIAQKWELRTFEETQNKEQYAEKMEMKLNEIRQRRVQQAGNIPLGAGGMMPNQMGNNGMMRPGNMMGAMPNMSNMGNMQNMGNVNGMNGMGFPNNTMGQQQNLMNGQNPMFPAQLSRPMQPSPVNMPGQTGTLDPAALQMPQQARQQQQQQQQNNMNQAGQQQMANMGQGVQGQAGPQLNPLVAQRARQMYEKMPEEQKQAIRTQMIAQMPEAQRQAVRQHKRDPLMQFCIKRAQQAMDEQRRQQMAGQQNAGMTANGNMQMNGNNTNNNGIQRPPSQAGGQNFDVSGILGQQANALKLQDAGEQVVPASNNNSNNFNMGLGNQMNQSINPQMLANQASLAGQSGNNAMSQQQAAFYSQQRNAQQQERLQKQMMAQQHALQSARMQQQQQQQQQQQNQLTGQPGGLHAPNSFAAGVGGQVPSPAMSMLNRPMVPPGQATPGTPQTNRQQPMAQTPANGTNQLLQHHQSMLNQNNHQQGQQGPQMHPQQLQQMLQRVPPEFREKLARMPPGDMQAMLMKMSAQRQQNSVNQPNQMNQAGMPGMQQQNVQPNQNMLQQQMSNAVPGFNAQPPPSQQNMQMNNQAAMLRNAQQQQLLRIRQQIMDSKPYPRQVLTMLNISVPPQVQKWQELKQHVMQNGSVVPQQTLERVQQMQHQWYTANPQEVNSALQAYIAQQRRSQDQSQNGQQSQAANMQQQVSTGGSQAPPAQMVPPAPMMQMPTPNGPAAGDAQQQPIPPQMHAQVLRMISPDDIQRFRSAIGARAQGMNDDQIRQILANQRIERWRSTQRAQQQGQRPPSQTPQIPRQAPVNMSSANQAHQRTPQTGINASQKAPQPANDDVVEIANPAMQQQAPQAPSMQASQSQQRGPTQEQLAQMTPEQKAAWMQKRQAQMEALRKAQGGVGNAGPGLTGAQGDLAQKLSSMMKEIQNSSPKGPPVNYDAQGQERVRASLQRLWRPVLQMSQTFPTAMTWGMEQQLRDLIRTKLILQQNSKDEHGTMRDFYSVTQQQLQDMEKSVAAYMNEFKSTQLRIQAQKSASAKEQQSQAPPMATASSQPGHSRKSSNMRAPPAPTDDKKFDWSAQSPGLPMYAQDQPGLTQDKLKFPPQKKRKPNQAGSQVSTPAAQTGTPATAGASPALANIKGQQSPEQVRRTQQQLRAEAERAEREAESRKFRCKDTSCEHSLQGFDTEAQLNEHDKTQHQPVQNPLDFFLENATTALELDGQGSALQKPDAPAAKVIPPQVKPRLTVKDLKPEELTKQEMDQIKKNIISPAVKQKLAKKQAEADAASEKEKKADKEPTMREALSKKLDVPLAEAESIDPSNEGADSSVDDVFDLGLSGYDNNGLDIFGMDANQMTLESIQEMANMGSNWEPVDGDLSSWRLVDDSDLTNSSPELTPDGSQSSHSSDVRDSDTMRFVIGVENDAWDAWETGENLVAESMIPIYTQIKQMMNDGANANSESDTEMKESEGASPKKRKAVGDVWDVPVQDFLNYDFFGAQQKQS